VSFTFFNFLTSQQSRKAHSGRALTLFGWTPGLRQLVSTRLLSCGCVAGVYETWSGGRTVIVDERHTGCQDPHHDANAVLDAA
jgi:hypothetical protein